MTKEQRAVRTTGALKRYEKAFDGDTYRAFYPDDVKNIMELTREEWGTYNTSWAAAYALKAGYMLGYEQATRDIKKGKAANV